MIPKAPYADCENCPLYDQACVPTYYGSDNIQLIVVGEAPGYYEAKAGKPFVGPSGKVLDYLLAETKIDQASVMKTNAVLCQAPDNEVPRAALEACQERLRAEVAAYPGAIMVGLGASALASLRGSSRKDEGILKSRGLWSETTDGREFMPTLHPAFVLRSPGYFTSLMNDFRALTLDRSKDWLATEYLVSSGTHFPVSLALENGASFAYDVETTGLDAHNSDLICLAIALDDEIAYIFDVAAVKQLRGSLNAFFQANKPIAHNGKFDNHILHRYGIDITQSDDTMLMHYTLDENKGTHGLKHLASTYLGVPNYEAELVDKYFRTIERSKRDYSKIPREDLYKYVAIDVCATYALRELFDPMIDADNVRLAYQIALDASNTLQLAERRGIKIDRPYLKKVLDNINDALAENEDKVQYAASVSAKEFLATKRIDQYASRCMDWCDTVDQYRAVVEKIAYGYTDSKKNVFNGVNLRSWQQLQVLLYDILDLTHQKIVGFKTKPRSTNAEALDALAPLNHPFVKIFQEYRRIDKIRSTYVEPLLRMADSNDRVHVNFLIHGTETGRLSASDSLHGIPRPSDIWGQAIRGSFIADKDKKLVIADYSQAELRCFAAESCEPFLLDKYNNNKDVHTETAILLFGDQYTTADTDTKKELRTIAKNVNFGGLVYLGGASGIVGMIRAQTGRDITEAQVKPVLDQLKAKMPVAAKWQAKQFAFAKKHGYVQSRFGNKRRFPFIVDANLEEIRKASVNAVIQNEASQLTLCSAMYLMKAEQLNVVHLVHDSIIIECDDWRAKTVAALTEAAMTAIGQKHFPEVKWKADVEIVDRWYQKRPAFD